VLARSAAAAVPRLGTEAEADLTPLNWRLSGSVTGCLATADQGRFEPLT